ncbi:hypothetical protein PROFUN_16172 [Planoprotostelium fungivorum]|uniref:Uncharacterized protein n=1 Tax=Planoprotostelium fungivorum TaxID=1890364 RepID=A0A2P6MSA3_9EUKA|nr:hypothetical protein PROFUN_16172 [Planoprotostelium fungivorum]
MALNVMVLPTSNTTMAHEAHPKKTGPVEFFLVYAPHIPPLGLSFLPSRSVQFADESRRSSSPAPPLLSGSTGKSKVGSPSGLASPVTAPRSQRLEEKGVPHTMYVYFSMGSRCYPRRKPCHISTSQALILRHYSWQSITAASQTKQPYIQSPKMIYSTSSNGCTIESCTQAAMADNLGLMQWLLEKGYPLNEDQPWFDLSVLWGSPDNDSGGNFDVCNVPVMEYLLQLKWGESEEVQIEKMGPPYRWIEEYLGAPTYRRERQ